MTPDGGLEGKSRLLDELSEVCGYDRKYTIKLLGLNGANGLNGGRTQR